jgi:two-component system chemotaxis response regulator CheB
VTPIDLIVIGCSLGGMRALSMILGALPADFEPPIAAVQHRHKASNEGLPAFLRTQTKLPVVDVDDGLYIRPRHVYLAPANYHLLIEKGRFDLSVDAAVSYSRPSIDVLFESAAEAYRAGVVAVVLTGANADGARGAFRIKQQGGFVIVQEPQTAEAPDMPQAAINAVRVDRILPLERIGPFLVELWRQTQNS